MQLPKHPFRTSLAILAVGVLLCFFAQKPEQEWLLIVGSIVVFGGWLLWVGACVRSWRSENGWFKQAPIWKKALLGLGFAGILLSGIRLTTLRSDAYAAAVAYVKHDANIQKELGPIQSCVLPIFASSSITRTGARGQAHFELHATGAAKSGTFEIELVRDQGNWTVRRCDLIEKN
jgi:hypothetical protein